MRVSQHQQMCLSEFVCVCQHRENYLSLSPSPFPPLSTRNTIIPKQKEQGTRTHARTHARPFGQSYNATQNLLQVCWRFCIAAASSCAPRCDGLIFVQRHKPFVITSHRICARQLKISQRVECDIERSLMGLLPPSRYGVGAPYQCPLECTPFTFRTIFVCSNRNNVNQTVRRFGSTGKGRPPACNRAFRISEDSRTW